MSDSKKDARSALIAEAQSAASDILKSSSDMAIYDGINVLAKYNKSRYNAMKLAEELAELSEVVLKWETKIPEKRPDIQDIIDETGDVMLRIGVYIIQKSIELEESEEALGKKVEERLETKLRKLLSYIAEGKYPGGV